MKLKIVSSKQIRETQHPMYVTICRDSRSSLVVTWNIGKKTIISSKNISLPGVYTVMSHSLI